MMKYLFPIFLLWSSFISAQNANENHKLFCRNLHKIMESGRMDNFQSVMAASPHVSFFIQTPGQSMHLDQFPTFYVDKDSRFVAKTDLNMDSLSALKKIEALKNFVSACLDSTQWTWLDFEGDDSATVFFHEMKEYMAVGKELTLTLAMDRVAEKTYSVNLYLRRNGR